MAQDYERKLDEAKEQLEVARVEVTKDFPREEEYREKCERLARLNAELSIDDRPSPESESQVAEAGRAYLPAAKGKTI